MPGPGGCLHHFLGGNIRPSWICGVPSSSCLVSTPALLRTWRHETGVSRFAYKFQWLRLLAGVSQTRDLSVFRSLSRLSLSSRQFSFFNGRRRWRRGSIELRVRLDREQSKGGKISLSVLCLPHSCIQESFTFSADFSKP